MEVLLTSLELAEDASDPEEVTDELLSLLETLAAFLGAGTASLGGMVCQGEASIDRSYWLAAGTDTGYATLAQSTRINNALQPATCRREYYCRTGT